MIVSPGFHLSRQFFPGCPDNLSLVNNVYNVGYNIIEQALIMCDDHKCIFRRFQLIDTLCYYTQCINVQPTVGLVKKSKPGFEHGHLEYLVPFLFSTRKAHLHTPAHKRRIHLHNGHFLTHDFEKLS